MNDLVLFVEPQRRILWWSTAVTTCTTTMSPAYEEESDLNFIYTSMCNISDGVLLHFLIYRDSLGLR